MAMTAARNLLTSAPSYAARKRSLHPLNNMTLYGHGATGVKHCMATFSSAPTHLLPLTLLHTTHTTTCTPCLLVPHCLTLPHSPCTAWHLHTASYLPTSHCVL